MTQKKPGVLNRHKPEGGYVNGHYFYKSNLKVINNTKIHIKTDCCTHGVSVQLFLDLSIKCINLSMLK